VAVVGSYNPIVRTFCRLRAVLVDTLGVDRRQVCPATPLDALIPAERRGEVFARLREEGFRAPHVEVTVQEWPLCWLAAFIPLAVIVPMTLGSWLGCAVALPLAIGLGVLACTVRRSRVVRPPLLPRTVGEMVIYLTHFAEHEGYRFSRNEIALKVRFVVAGWLGVSVDQVREDSEFINLEAW
jgi:hypothetical protein